MRRGWLVALALFSAATDAQASAGCLIRLGDRALLVRDAWSRRLSLPGGGGEPGENARQTAVRETLEETGLRVRVGETLRQWPWFTIFSCEPEERVTLLTFADGVRLIPPPSSLNEIEEVVAADPSLVPARDWRFPDQADAVIDAFRSLRGFPGWQLSEFRPFDPGTVSGLGISLIQSMQAARGSWTDAFFRLFSFLGEEFFFYLAVPLFWLWAPWRRGAKLTLLLCLSTLANGLLKDFFQLGRPFEWVPELQRMSAVGYGFPSGHAQIAAVFWAYAASGWRDRRVRLGCAALVFLCGLARCYLGVHFPHDVAGGWLVGLALTMIFVSSDRKGRLESFLEGRGGSWALWGALGAFSLYARFHRETVAIVALWAGLLIGMRIGREARETLGQPTSRLEAAMRALVATAGLFVISVVFAGMAGTQGDATPLILIQGLKYLAFGVWVSALSQASLQALGRALGFARPGASSA
jgi:undecaprenyl-diphosphatase